MTIMTDQYDSSYLSHFDEEGESEEIIDDDDSDCRCD